MRDDSFASTVSEVAVRTGLPQRAATRWIEVDDRWISVGYRPERLPEQGWKLHVAASVHTAADVLRATLPTLLEDEVHFKVAATLRHLAALNEGVGGLSQVGKFVTVYPADDEQALRLATRLAASTAGLRGPVVPTDRALRPGSVVHYRFGGFGDLQLRTALGDVVPALRTPEGTLVPDERRSGRYAPTWQPDPFLAAGVATALPELPRLLRDRYLLITRLHWSPRSQVYLCLDTSARQSCILKRVTDDGHAGAVRLQREAEVLAELADDPRFPSVRDLFECAGDWFLAMDDLAGQPLEAVEAAARQRNAQFDDETVARWGGELAEILHTLHLRGWAYGDVKPSNVVLRPSGTLGLVDLELACPLDGATGPEVATGGTRGYLSPRRLAGGRPTVADDVYGLGALLYLLVTGAEPSCAPDPGDLLTRPVALLNPDVGTSLVDVVERCLAADPADRFASAESCAAALRTTRERHMPRRADRSPRAALDAAGALDLARRIGDVVCGQLTPASRTIFAGGRRAEPWPSDVNLGTAGAALVLSQLVTVFGDPTHRDTLVQTAQSLALDPRPSETFLPGLYVGEAGRAAALLRAGWVLGDDALLDRALDLGDRVAALPYRSPDVFNGSAGRLRYHLWAWRLAGRFEDLGHAVAAARHLLHSARRSADRCSWVFPSGYDSLSGKQLIGYAHGAAGIADALLDLYDVTHDPVLVEVADEVGTLLAETACPALTDGSGLNWPEHLDGDPTMAFWCHGAAGIVRFLLHRYEIGGNDRMLDLACRAGRVVSLGTRWAGPLQCHGLAGNIEALLDLRQATGEEAYLTQAREIAALLPAFALSEAGHLVFVTDHDRTDLGFTHGASGVASCLLRLADPRRRHLLGVAGFTTP